MLFAFWVCLTFIANMKFTNSRFLLVLPVYSCSGHSFVCFGFRGTIVNSSENAYFLVIYPMG
jgi:hypothetical protein